MALTLLLHFPCSIKSLIKVSLLFFFQMSLNFSVSFRAKKLKPKKKKIYFTTHWKYLNKTLWYSLIPFDTLWLTWKLPRNTSKYLEMPYEFFLRIPWRCGPPLEPEMSQNIKINPSQVFSSSQMPISPPISWPISLPIPTTCRILV